MNGPRRTLIASAGIASASLAACAPGASPSAAPTAVVAELTARTEEANAALMRGDLGRYEELVAFGRDFTLMSPFGGAPTRAREVTPERMEAMGRFFQRGTHRQELLEAYASEDLVVLAVLEHSNVEVGGLPAQDWSLRVTIVYRREGDDWRLVHRHADPLVAGIRLDEAAELARRPIGWRKGI